MFRQYPATSLPRLTLAISFLALSAATAQAQAPECAGWDEANRMAACDVVRLPVGHNTEALGGIAQPPIGGAGFLISIDGAPVAGNPALADTQRRVDLQLSAEDIELRFDGFGVQPRLDAQVLGRGPAQPGAPVTLRNRMNYPAFVTRGELRIYDMQAPGGGTRLLQTLPFAPNGDLTVTLPQGADLHYVMRVYDAAGRYDETRPMPFDARDVRGLAQGPFEDDGSDNTASRNIPVRGGAVTVHARNLPAGARVQTLGTVVTPDPSGAAVVQRILPVGRHGIDIEVPGQIDITRDLTIPASDWFHVGVLDLSIGHRLGNLAEGVDRNWTRGRAQFYATGKTAGGYDVTLSADTREDELSALLRNVLRKDPLSVLNRMDPDLYYPTYGDDSVIYDDTPTSSGLYVRVEKDNNMVLWGDFKSQSGGSHLLRNERSLYGAQVVLQSQAQTAGGAPRLQLDAYAAEPDQLPQRDVLRGTGGSVYFLSRQDILEASETLSVQLRDPDTGRIISTRMLVHGRDYMINYTQGVVTLFAPLSGFAGGSGGLVGGAGDDSLYLVAQYEWVPLTGDIDGMAFGARAEAWANDQLRLGLSAQVDRTGSADQTSYGADILWQHSEGTYIEAEAARSEGPGFGFTHSIDGGLTLDTTGPAAGTGEAYRLRARADLAEVIPGTEGYAAAWYEKRTAGFSSLDHQTREDEENWGAETEFALSARSDVALSFEHYKSDSGKRLDEARLAWIYQLSAGSEVTLAYGFIDRIDPLRADRTGRRHDIGLRYARDVSDRLAWHVFGQATLAHSGEISRGDRIGIGADYALNDQWRVAGEVSAGATGPGGHLMFRFEGADTSGYFGYTLDPDRAFDDVVLTGRDRGKFITGARKRFAEHLTVFGENSYDLFGERRTLATAYGVEYVQSNYLTYTGAVEFGRVTDAASGDLDRAALSLGARYQDDAGLTMRGRLELRRDRGSYGGTIRDSHTIMGNFALTHEINDAARVVTGLQFVLPRNDGTAALPEGDYLRYDLGYAFRPTDNDRLNVLARYQYLHDLYGQRLDGTDTRGPRQKSHIFSIDAEYDLTERWTLGGKIGLRLSETSPGTGAAFTGNDAWLAVISARYHVVHNWDLLIEARQLGLRQAGTTETGLVLGAYRHFGEHVMMGVNYNFGRFSDDLSDLTHDDRGVSLNLIAKF